MILVTGATGLVGRHLLLALSAQNKKVRAIYRSESKKEEVEEFLACANSNMPDLYAFRKDLQPYVVQSVHTHKKHSIISWHKADIIDIPALEPIFNGVEIVYHCAALISFNPYRFNKLIKINVEGTANVVNLALANNIKKLCHLSSIATLGKLPNNPKTEENQWDSNEDNSVYAISKFGAETEVWRGSQEGLNVIIFNPGIILGEGNLNQGSSKIFRRILKGQRSYPTGSSGFIDVKDLVNLMIRGTESEQLNQRFIAVGHNASFKDVFSEIAELLGKKAPQKPLNTAILRFAAALDRFYGFFTHKRQLTKAAIQAIQKHQEYDNSKIVDAFAYKPTDLKTSLVRICRYYKF